MAKHALIRIETECYGKIISTHRGEEYAQAAYERKCNEVCNAVPNALPHLMYAIALVDGKKGDRVRYA